ncbi:TetR family transcriptional regulator [Mycobacteroides abscessus subsp. massiliense]|uniref:TetR/AcrR family transcriptional regulator n=1 Tax=Mycobacteroides abscessus TaxID=36809 RepID=UPI0009A60E1B|nr:TetR/AcrR family transcriptional regulator [Mycobacteroides abscessus]SKU60960.1 TetR family transcriptional regulator [Mycobacteroides abscessus subsp. massiliense]
MTAEARDHIVDVAVELFAQQGISATSMAQIAKAAKISRAWLYRNFDSRDPIVQAALARYSAHAATMLTEADRTDRSLDQAVIAVFCYLVTRGRRERHIAEILATDPDSVLGPAVAELQHYLVVQRSALDQTRGQIAAEAIGRLILSAITTSSATFDFDEPETLRAFTNQVIPQLLNPN